MRINRRTVMAGSATLALGATAAPLNARRGLAQSPNNMRLIQLAALDPALQASLDSNPLIVKKRALASKFAWLQPFAADLPVDSLIFNTTSSLSGVQPPYDPYQIEALAASVSTTLDRCLTYRQNMYALDEKATQRALEYDLFQNQLDAQKAIELAASLGQKWNNEKTGQASAAKTFSSDTDSSTSNISKGFAALAKISSSSASILAAGEQTRQQNVNAKWAAAVDYQTSLQARHSAPGNALNYVERYQRIAGMLQQDIGVCYQKLRCLSNACNTLFGLNVPLEPPMQVGYLDYLVTYTRNLLNQVEIATVNEVNFNHVVYLRQSRSLTSTNTSNTPRVSSSIWDTTLAGTRLFTFNLKDNEFSTAITRLRMQSIGLSMTMGNPAPQDPTATLKFASAILFPPQVPDLFSPGGLNRRPPIIIEGIGMTSPSGPIMISSPAIRNIDPRGEWRLQVSSNFYQPDPTRSEAPSTELKDVKIHMSLTALMSSDSNDWQDFAS